MVEAVAGAAPLVTAAELKLRAGATVKRSEIKAAIDMIQAKYAAAGFPSANIVPMTTVDAEAKTLAIKIEVSRTGATP